MTVSIIYTLFLFYNIISSAKLYSELANAKKELAFLKKQLFEKEAKQSEELHQLRLEKERELYNQRIEGQRLKNEILKLQLEKLNN